MWRCLNCLCSGVARAKTEPKKWSVTDPSTSVICKCGEDDTIQHLLACSLLDEPCFVADLCQFNEPDGAMKCCKIQFKIPEESTTHKDITFGTDRGFLQKENGKMKWEI